MNNNSGSSGWWWPWLVITGFLWTGTLHIPGCELESAASASFDSAPKAHFLASRLSPIASHDYPLTWEIGASQASHGGMKIIDAILAEQNTATPHTRHATGVFLHLVAPGRVGRFKLPLPR